MASSGPPQKSAIQSRPRLVRLVLRDGDVIEGGIYLNEGQALAPYLGSRKGGWVNIINARWLRAAETHMHAVMQTDHILIAMSVDGDIPVYGMTAAPAMRDVDIALDDASHVRGTLLLSQRQRLSDYLHSCGKFLPVVNATRLTANGALGDCALNCLAIRVIRDSAIVDLGSPELAPDVAFETRPTGQIPAVPPPVNTEVVAREGASINLITEGRVPDRRNGRPYLAPAQVEPEPEPPPPDLTSEQIALADTLARHWLVRIAVAARLSAPDPRALSAAPSLEEIWSGLSRENDIAEGELAVHVATAFKVAVADLNEVTAAALASVPERVARKLGVLPLTGDARTLVIAISDPNSMEIEQQLGFVTRKHLSYRIAAPSEIRGALDWHYGMSSPD